MSDRRSLWGTVKLLVLPALCWTALASAVWAQQDAKEEVAPPQPFLLAYVAVVFGIGLGMWTICRPSRREDRAKTEAMAASLSPEQLLKSGKAGAKGPQAARPKGLCPEARTALILAIVGLFICAPLEFVALQKAGQAKEAIASNPRLTGKELATAAQVIAWIAIVLWLLGFVLRIVARVAAS